MISFIRYLMFIAALFWCVGKSVAQIQLGLPINLPNSVEKSPALSLDGKHIAYISNENGGWQIFEAYQKPDGLWDDPMAIDSINKFVSVAAKIDHPCFSGDGQRLYFAADFPGGKGGLDIYYSDLVNGKWTKPINLGEPVNSAANDDMPSISADGAQFYFARTSFEKKDDLLRCLKIWVAESNSNGGWKSPVPLPNLINSGCEESPRIFPDGKLMLFSSMREDGKKAVNPNLRPKPGFDIYATNLITKNVWSQPFLLYMMNSDADDYSPTLSPITQQIYYSSTKELKNQVSGGIYMMKAPDTLQLSKLLTVTGILSDGTTGKPLAGTVKVTDLISQKEILTFKTSSIDGTYYLNLNPNSSYQLDFTAQNYSHIFKSFDFFEATEDKTEKLDVKLFNQAKFKMKVFDSETFQPLDAKVKISPQSPAQFANARFDQDGTGTFNFSLPVNRKYVLQIESPNYQVLNLSIDLSFDIQNQNLELETALNPAKDNFEISTTDQTGQLYDTDIEVIEISSGNIISSKTDANSGLIQRIGTGKFEVKLHLGQRYRVDAVAAKGFISSGEIADISDLLEKKMSVKVANIKTGNTLLLKEIQFIGNTSEFAASSEIALKKLAETFAENPQLKTEINAYCNDKLADEMALKLSTKRAQAVVDYLLEKGIKPNRLNAKGFGKSNPLVPNENDANRKKNERIELKIVE